MTDRTKHHASFLRALAASASHPGLRSVMLFDADTERFDFAAECLRTFLETFSASKVETIGLNAYQHDEHLWDGDALLDPDGSAGMLVQRTGVPGFRVVLVRDLSTLSVEAARACAVLMDAPVAHLERHDRRRIWAPRLLWLLACPRDAVNEISPHLMDRIALRLHPSGTARDRGQRLRERLARDGRSDLLGNDAVSRAVREVDDQVSRLRRRVKRGHVFDETLSASLAEKIDALVGNDAAGARRQIALLRLSVALARLDCATFGHRCVDEAAALLGLSPPSDKANIVAPNDRAPDAANAPAQATQTKAGITAAEIQLRFSKPDTTARLERVEGLRSADPVAGTSDSELVLVPTGSAPEPGTSPAAYPEDKVVIEREHAILQRSRPRRNRSFGTPIGVRPTDRASEIAIFPTLLAAAPWQRLRRDRHPARTSEWLVYRSDWRTFRYAPAAETMLVLVLDLTSSEEALFDLVPYLRRAYVERSTVRVVLVGAAGAKNELRAEVVTARTLLSPNLRSALDCKAGRATPLAHGLSLAARLAREHCFRGRGLAHTADIVVATDGLGNVPLEASLAGRLAGKVSREGIDDALRAADEIHRINAARVVVIPPRRLRAEHVFTALVEALGADVDPLGRRRP